MKKCLTIGGSDSGGAVGVQADLRAWTKLGVYGMSALTVVTAQNSVSFAGAQFVEPNFVAKQIETVLSDYGADAIKTGFIGRVDTVHAIADAIQHHPTIVIDPVLVNQRGEAMFSEALTQAYRERLLPLAQVVTPTLREAEVLWGRPITTRADLLRAAEVIAARGCYAVLIKRFYEAGQLFDYLYWNGIGRLLQTTSIDTHNTQGAGDTLSAVIVAQLANQQAIGRAVALAQQYVHDAIQRGSQQQLGAGRGPVL